MTLKEFVNKYNGTGVDFDKKYGFQCVDLFRQYCKDVLNIEHTGSVVGAKDLYTEYENLPKEMKYFERIPYTEKIVSGDVAIWNSSNSNQYGHVAIILCEMQDCLVVFEQNGFTQDGAKIVLRDKINLLGFLRKKI